MNGRGRFGPAPVQSSGGLPDQTHLHSVQRPLLHHPVSYAGRVHRGNRGPGGHLVRRPYADELLIGASFGVTGL